MFHVLYKIFQKFSRTERRIFTGSLAVFLVASFFIILNFYYQNTAEQPKRHGKYSEGVIGQPTSINPLISGNNSVNDDLIEIIFSGLDDLVESYQINENNRSWTITLKENLLWSDGEPVTADDVIFTLEVIQDPANNHHLYTTWQGIVVERLNQNEIRLTLKTPYVFLIDNLRELKIAPRHIFQHIPPANFRLSQYNLEPIGSGPYKFSSFETRKDGFISNYNLIINNNYHGDQPFIEEINFKFYASEEDLVTALNKREIDAVGGLNPKSLDEININYQLINLSIPRYFAVFFNPNVSEPLKNKNVRQALNLSTDKQKMIKHIFREQAAVINGPLPPNIGGYDQSIVNDQIFDIKKAERLLDQAGFTKNEEGDRIKFDIIVPQISFLTEAAEILKDDWSKIGVKLNIIALNPNDISNDVIRTRNYELLIFGNILKKNPDIFSFWHSSEIFYPGRNLALYNVKKIDNLLEEMRQDFNNQSRLQKISEIQQNIINDFPVVFLFNPNYLYLTDKNLSGFDSFLISSQSKRFENVEKWHLKTSRIFK